MNWNTGKIYDFFINKSHVILGSICQTAILVFHWHTGKDLGPSVAQTVNWFYAFLAGHFVGSQVWPDKGKDGENQ